MTRGNDFLVRDIFDPFKKNTDRFFIAGFLFLLMIFVSMIPVIGGLFASIVVKQLCGGLGQNFMNPALGARCFLLISFAGIMTNFSYNGFGVSFDATTSATPLAALKAGEFVNLKAMFLSLIHILLISSYSIPMAVSKVVSAKMAVHQYKIAHKVFKCALIYLSLIHI